MGIASSRILTASIAALAGAGLASTGVALAHGGGGAHSGHLLHGQLVVGDASHTRTHDVQNGKVTAVLQRHVKVRSEDGFVATYKVNSRTAVFGGFTRHSRTSTPMHGTARIATGDIVSVDALERTGVLPLALTIKDFGSPTTMKPLARR